MNKQMGIIIIFAICVLILLIGMLKRKAQIFLGFVARIAAGAAAIYLTNQMLPTELNAIAVGINPVSLLTVGVLGAGGFGLMYGITIYSVL